MTGEVEFDSKLHNGTATRQLLVIPFMMSVSCGRIPLQMGTFSLSTVITVLWQSLLARP